MTQYGLGTVPIVQCTLSGLDAGDAGRRNLDPESNLFL